MAFLWPKKTVVSVTLSYEIILQHVHEPNSLVQDRVVNLYV